MIKSIWWSNASWNYTTSSNYM